MIDILDILLVAPPFVLEETPVPPTPVDTRGSGEGIGGWIEPKRKRKEALMALIAVIAAED